MKNTTAVILFLGCASLGYSQETSRFEVFGGYTFANHLRLPLSLFSSRNGWEGAFKYNITSRIGLVAEVDGRAGTDFRELSPSTSTTVFLSQPVSTYTFLFGPEVNVYRYRRVAINLRALAGFVHADDSHANVSVFSLVSGPDQVTGQQQFLTTRSFATNTFSMAAGGNVDVRLGRGFSWRAVQPEMQLTRPDGRSQPNFRISTGLVFGFGKR
jgi:hypothetical protein